MTRQESEHVVQFSAVNGRWWAWCRCGWIDWHSDRETLSGAAARHDNVSGAIASGRAPTMEEVAEIVRSRG